MYVLDNEMIQVRHPLSFSAIFIIQHCRSGLFKRPFGQNWSLFSLFL